jgi:type IV pilus assembly protein PilV
MSSNPAKHRSMTVRYDRGFSLIEVLVALVVLSVGLLGLAALQSTAAQFNAGAYTRSQATILAYDMADRIRANREAAQNGDYNSGLMGVPPACNAVVGGTVAQQDLGAWHRALACSLPSGNGSVACDCDPADPGATHVLTITVQWDETNREDPADATQTFVMRTGL